MLAYLTSQRTSEIGIRMALGATVRDISRLVLSQALRMALAGVLLGTLGAFAAARFLEHLVQGMQSADAVTFVITISVLALSVFLAGFLPARRASKVDPVTARRQE